MKAAMTFLLVGVLVLVLAFVAMAALRSGGGGGSDVDCSTFSVTPQRWAAADYDRRIALHDGMIHCGRLIGQTRARVEAQLGPAGRASTKELDYPLPYPDSSEGQVLRVYLGGDGRVTSVDIASPETGAP